MEIRKLELHLSDDDLAAALAHAVEGQDDVEDLDVSIKPEGVVLKGTYPTPFGMKVPFETTWEVTPAGTTVRARLANLKVAGMPGGILRGALLRLVKDQAEELKGVTVEGDAVTVDLAAAAKPYKVDVRVNVTAVRLSVGVMVVEAG